MEPAAGAVADSLFDLSGRLAASQVGRRYASSRGDLQEKWPMGVWGREKSTTTSCNRPRTQSMRRQNCGFGDKIPHQLSYGEMHAWTKTLADRFETSAWRRTA